MVPGNWNVGDHEKKNNSQKDFNSAKKTPYVYHSNNEIVDDLQIVKL